MDRTKSVFVLLGLVLCLVPGFMQEESSPCKIPLTIRNTWFSFELGQNTLTEINAETMSNRGFCVAMHEDKSRTNYTFVFQKQSCYFCVKLIVRTLNVLDKIESTCINLPEGVEPTVQNVCRTLKEDQQMITLFSENYVPVNCRSSLEGVWQFTYQNRFRFTGECNNPDAQIRSCQEPGTQFFITNQKFNITYKKCPNMDKTIDAVVEYNCLGHWYVDKNHYFAVANTKESRKEEKYRCFLRNRDDDLYIGVSITPECNTLKTPEQSPERLRITPVKPEIVIPDCTLPKNMSGEWINTDNANADIFINDTHIIETFYPDAGRQRKTIYVCRQQRDTRVMMTRLGIDGCQKDYICFDFVPRHHNVIRYRRGIAFIHDDFSTVCSWVKFKNSENWRYDTYLAKNPVAVRCPVAGKFRFNQTGEILFETRILGGITQSPRHNTNCTQQVSDFSVCGKEQKELTIDETYCLDVDHLGRPRDIYSEPDYRMKCIGYWKENLKSYLITYDELDPFSKYRCWVYQRADLHKVLMSQALGPYCHIKQNVDSNNYTEGAAVAINMTENERERDQCPLFFDDGSNPWSDTSSSIQLFHFTKWSGGVGGTTPSIVLSTLAAAIIFLLLDN